MRIWAISDLYLPGGSPRRRQTMETQFGFRFNKIAETWDALVPPDELVLIPGDISWATTTQRARWDMEWLAARSGLKVVGRGDQDRWWDRWEGAQPTGVKLVSSGLNEFNGVTVIMLSGSPVPGSREWSRLIEEEYLEQVEVLRSLLQKAARNGVTPIVAMHWPPMVRDTRSGFSDVLEEFQMPLCLYGHLHGQEGQLGPVWRVRGVRYQLVAADNTRFAPMPLELYQSSPPRSRQFFFGRMNCAAHLVRIRDALVQPDFVLILLGQARPSGPGGPAAIGGQLLPVGRNGYSVGQAGGRGVDRLPMPGLNRGVGRC